MRSETFARRLVRWFPLNWRARYEDEFVALLEAAPRGWRTTLDVVQDCIAEWSHEIGERLVRVVNATGRFAAGARLVILLLFGVALFIPAVVAGNAVCSVIALGLLSAGWTLPASLGILAYLLGAVFSVLAMYQSRKLTILPPAILVAGIILTGVLVKMDRVSHHVALLSLDDLISFIPGIALGYLVPLAWFRTPGLPTRPEPAPATVGLTVLGLSGATKS